MELKILVKWRAIGRRRERGGEGEGKGRGEGWWVICTLRVV